MYYFRLSRVKECPAGLENRLKPTFGAINRRKATVKPTTLNSTLDPNS